MAFKMPNLFGAKPPSAGADDLDMPTTQVKMAAQNAPGYDPLASVSIMEQLRSASQAIKVPRKIPILGSMPVVKQFQVLGTLLAMFPARRRVARSAPGAPSRRRSRAPHRGRSESSPAARRARRRCR